MRVPAPAVELFGQLAYYFFEIQPELPLYTHLLVSALFPIYTGAHATLTRPSTAAEPPKKPSTRSDEDPTEEDEDEEQVQRMEGLSPSDALVMPLLAGATLAGLYFLIKWLKDPALLNKILNWYFAFFGVVSVSRFLTDGMTLIHGVVFPKRYLRRGLLWDVDGKEKVATPKDLQSGEVRKDFATVKSPLPGLLSRLWIPGFAHDKLWAMRNVPKQQWTVKAYLHRVVAIRTKFGLFGVVGFGLGFTAVLYFNFVDKPWFLTNLMGFAFSYGALQLMSPVTFATGSLLLSALFFYDIYMVFFTPMMVTVAKSLDIPIKLMFPRPDLPADQPDQPPIKQHAMLGLGDIVIPGIMIGLALRFDLYMFYLRKQMKQTSRNDSKTTQEVIKASYVPVSRAWGDKIWARASAASFPKPYFTASMTGYVLGMATTLLVMHFMEHAQPALLYLVPGVLISLWFTALVRGELKEMWEFSEAEEDVSKDGKTPENDHDKIGGASKQVEKENDQAIKDDAAAGRCAPMDGTSGDESDDTALVDGSSTKQKDRNNRDLVSFSIIAPFPLKKPKVSKTTRGHAADAGEEAHNATGDQLRRSRRKWHPVSSEDEIDGEQAEKRRRTS